MAVVDRLNRLAVLRVQQRIRAGAGADRAGSRSNACTATWYWSDAPLSLMLVRCVRASLALGRRLLHVAEPIDGVGDALRNVDRDAAGEQRPRPSRSRSRPSGRDGERIRATRIVERATERRPAPPPRSRRSRCRAATVLPSVDQRRVGRRTQLATAVGLVDDDTATASRRDDRGERARDRAGARQQQQRRPGRPASRRSRRARRSAAARRRAAAPPPRPARARRAALDPTTPDAAQPTISERREHALRCSSSWSDS